NLNSTRLERPDVMAALSAATRQANFFGDRCLQLTEGNHVSYADAHLYTAPSRKLRMVLETAQRLSKHFGATFELNPKTEWPLFDAISSDEGWALICHVVEEQWIRRPISAAAAQNSYSITGKGWELLEPFHVGGIPGRCFVAMAFDKDLDAAYF